MGRTWTTCWAILLLAGAVGSSSAQMPQPAAPAIDKPKVESYLRYAEGFPAAVKLVLDDPVATPIAGYYRLQAHLSLGDTKQDKVYYLTADGKHIVGSPVWDIQDNPFLETVNKLQLNGPEFGPADARITLVVFNDFQCPYCREFARTLRDNLSQKYPKDVRVIFKDFPIDSLHPWARAAAEAGHCVGDGKPELFWAFHDWIFQHQGEVNASNLREKVLAFAKEHVLEEAKVGGCLDAHATKGEVEANLEQGRRLEVNQTPTFFLNGRVVPGAVPWATLNTLIQMELNRPAWIPGSHNGR